MATLAEVATRIPQAAAEATGKQLSPIIGTIKDTLNPANFLKAAGNVLQQEAPIFGMVGDIVGDFAGTLFGGASPEAETAENTQETKNNTEKTKENTKENKEENKKQNKNLITNRIILENLNLKIDNLNQEQVKTTNALLGNQPILNELSEAQQVSNEISQQSLQDAQQKEIANLELMRESSRKEDESIILQEETKDDQDKLLAGVLAGITAISGFFQNLFIGKLGSVFAGALANLGLGGLANAAGGAGGSIAKGASSLLPAVGLAAAGASLISGLFSGISAGIEEYEQSGDLGVAIKEGTAGFISGATFGLISQETISGTFDAIGRIADDTFSSLKTMASEAFVSLEAEFGEFNVFKFITETISDAVNSIKNIFSGDFSVENFATLFGSLTDIVYTPVNLAVNAVKDIFSLGDPEEPFSLSEFISGLIEDIFNMIKDILPSVDDLIPELPAVGDFIPKIPDVDDFIPEAPSLSDLTFGVFGGGDEKPPQPAQQAQPEENTTTKSTGGGFLDFFRREGGPVEAGSNYLVGEEGPELFFPNVSGSVVNNDETNQLLSRMQTVNNLSRTVEMLASQTVISDMTAEGTAAGGGQTIIAPQTNNNVTNNNMAPEKPTPKNVEPTISRLASMDYYFARP